MIKSFSIKNLFNQFSYEIDFKCENNISILVGPNGTGKTTIMEFISFVFSPSAHVMEKMIKVPFDSFEINMDDGVSFIVKKENHNDKVLPTRLELIIKTKSEQKTIDFLEYFDSYKADHRIGRSPYNFNLNDMEMYQEIVDGFAYDLSDKTDYDYPDKDSFQFIRANRFELVKTYNTRFSSSDDVEAKTSLEKINAEIQNLCADHTKEYISRLMDAANALPNLYLFEESDDWSFKEFDERLDAYKDKIARYTELGLLEKYDRKNNYEYSSNYRFRNMTPVNLVVDEELFEDKKAFLITYLKTFEATIGFFDVYYNKLKLFMDIFNKRNSITNKQMKYSSGGISILANGSELSIFDLSSGEKNDLVMFYELIFGTGDIVFIDEPEISLHIEWQADYLNQLFKICETNDIQIIIATHSPYIIYGHDDLVADKKVTIDKKVVNHE